MDFDEQYWTDRYDTGNDRWDIGHVSTPIKEYIDQLTNKDVKILIPGAGNSHEAEYIYNQGFTNIYVCDLSATPLDNLKNRVPHFPQDHLIHGDFFKIEDQFDLVIEQTFFCALDPSFRKQYVDQMSTIIKSTGNLAGLLFGKVFEREGPPFGGLLEDYKVLFSEKFDIKEMSLCTNSIDSRVGNELFINMKSQKPLAY